MESPERVISTARHPARRARAEPAEALIEGMANGSVRNRSGDACKPSVVRGYRAALDRHPLRDLGAMRLDGGDAIMPVRVIHRRALRAGEVSANPLEHLELPAVRGTRGRIAAPAEAAALLVAVPDRDRAVWATALCAGSASTSAATPSRRCASLRA